MTAIRYYLDDHVSRAIENGLHHAGIDALRSHTAGTAGIADSSHLAFATASGRAIYTNDADFLRLHSQGIRHAGIVYAPVGIPVREAIDGLTLIYQVLTAEEMQNHLEFL